MKKLYLQAFYLFFFFSGCEKGSSINSMYVDIAYRDKSGNDLFDLAMQNHFSFGSFHDYNVVNGIGKEDIQNANKLG
jgi:hypothetical protein